jgi:hypothetical protein
VADDPLTATLALDGDQTFTVHVIGATERPAARSSIPRATAMEPRVATVRRQLRVEHARGGTTSAGGSPGS